jgi:hypothetical protein
MAKVLREGEVYAGRRASAAVLNCTMDREALALLRQYAGEGKRLGELVARLIFTHHERQLERQQVREKLTLVLRDDGE